MKPKTVKVCRRDPETGEIKCEEIVVSDTDDSG